MTGNGTLLDPYLVSNRDELKEAMETNRSTGEAIYIKLTNNINLRWGSKWQTITTAGNDPVNVDFDGYSIKNIMVKNALFNLHKGDILKNGKIINIATASEFTDDYIYNSGTFEQLSMNCKIEVPTAAIFNNSKLVKDAISLRYTNSKPKTGQSVLNAIKLRAMDNASDANQIEECDIKIIIDEFDAADGDLIAPPVSGTCYINSSRITGEITSFKNSDATYYPIVSSVPLQNCVVEFSVPSYIGTAAPTAAHNFVTGDADHVSVVNTQSGILPYNNDTLIYSLGTGCTGCTTNELRSQYLLYPKLFEVYQIQVESE